MRRSVPTTPFDHESEAESDLTQEFWGESAGWRPVGDRASRRLPRVDDTGSLRALRDGVAAFRPQRVGHRDPSGEIRRTRAHGVTPATEPTVGERRATASIGELAAGHFDDADDRPAPDHDVALSPAAPVAQRLGLGGVDPLLVRLGALVLVGVLLVPLALALRPSGDAPDSVRIEAPDAAATGAVPTAVAVPDSVAGATVDPTGATRMAAPAATVDATAPAASAAAPAATVTDAAAVVGQVTDTTATASTTDAVDDSVGDVPQSVDGAIDSGATVDAAAERLVPECPKTYEAAPGDSWYRIADAAGVTPSALLAENRATVDVVILPGDDICLPSGATVPAPPTTDAPTTTQATTTAPSTTDAPTTTVAATVPSGSPGPDASVDEVKALIRSIFPESEWQTAYTIADRESRFDPRAYNGWCCYGVFQIYWSVHRSWLDDFGVTTSSDLFDPLVNVRAAHAIWQRSGNSWSAWSTYDG